MAAAAIKIFFLHSGGHFFRIFKFFIHFHIGVVSPSLEKKLGGGALFSGEVGGWFNFFLTNTFFTHSFSTYDLCDCVILQIYFLEDQAINGHFPR